ncbi:hypothetical protein [Streptacidiphilus fuscans]|uniref:Uncharacterized protein n=1 Tax=Streptacidiphilus fuscans TaxID=2789292 RepID=A0A931FJ47_9ACTN|nr:hypothetical protein [Streptacidiphilus fuscans]MBF9072409.1 hypothetical protein [Streptacidiphilus fuscans]
MSRIDALLGGSRPVSDESRQIWVNLPEGYTALPLTDVSGTLERAAAIVAEFAPEPLRELVAPTADLLEFLLLELSERGASYCGLGQHISPVDGTLVSSTLVVSLHSTNASGDPKQLLGEMAKRVDPASLEDGDAELVDLLGNPVLFLEGVRRLPMPENDDPSATSPLFTMEALVPSPDGDLLAAIEFATPFLDQGPQFRVMLAQFAASVSFEAPPPEPDTSSILSALG